MTHLLHDLRHALRTIFQRPGFAGAVICTAGIGIGVATAMFSVVNCVLLRPLPFADASELVYLGVRASNPLPFFATSTPDFVDWHDRLTTLIELGAMEPDSLVLVRDGVAARATVARMSPEVLPMFRVVPELGRPFLEDEYRTGGPPVALLSHGLWQRCGGDPGLVGTTIRTVGARDGDSGVLVVGVLPRGFEVPAAARMETPELWLPLAVDAQAHATSRTSRTLRVIGRLAPGMTVEQARTEAEALGLALSFEHPDAYMVSERGRLTIGVASLRDQTVGDTGEVVLILLGATGFLLLIACANNANLLLARAVSRRREIALRIAMGAGRTRIVAQLLVESSVLGGLGGGLGMVVAYGLVHSLYALAPADIPRITEVALDSTALAFAVAVSLATGLLFGLAPALATSREDPASALQEGGRGASAGTGTSRLRRALVVVETALALVLLSGAGLLATSFLRLQEVHPGFEAESISTLSIGLGEAFDRDEDRVDYLDRLTREVAAMPGFERVSFVSTLPVNSFTEWSPGILPEGRGEEPLAGIDGLTAGPDYFETMGIQVIAGRGLTARDDASGDPICVLSETAARRMWPDEPQVGRRLKVGSPDGPWVTVVGVVSDVRSVSLVEQSLGQLYLPYAQARYPAWTHLVLRRPAGGHELENGLADVMRRLNPDIPYDGLKALDERVARSVNRPRFNAFLWVTFAVAALLLAAVGISATMFNAVGQRSREIGIRVAFGAAPRDVLRMVLREGMALTTCGIAIGLAATAALSRLLAGLLFGVTPNDPTILAAVSAALFGVALVACSLPARRATMTDPVLALRSEQSAG